MYSCARAHVFQTSETLDVTEDSVTRKCFVWDSFGATADVCFTQRDDDATSGDFKVSDFEDMLNNAHKTVIDSGSCYDKWMDNHYAIDDSSGGSSTSADYIVDYINDSDDAYFYCTTSGLGAGLHYIVDPTGWGVQLDGFQFSSMPDGCQSAMAKMKKDGPPPPTDDGAGPPGMDDDVDDVCPCTYVSVCGYGDVTASDSS